MLAEAVASVKHQGVEVQHLVGVDHTRRGAGPVLNDLLSDAVGEWVMVLDDDDLLLPHHLATLTPYLEHGDVIYSEPIVEGGTFVLYEHPFDGELLRRRNLVSHNALMRTELVRDVGGWAPIREFDWDLFKRLHGRGASFVKVPEKTWVYRLHGSNWSQGTLAG